MADLDAIRLGLAANLASISDTQVSPYMLSEPEPPAIEIYPDKFFYDRGVRTDQLTFHVRAIVGFFLDESSQRRLDQMLDTTGDMSVKAALESNPTLDGLVDDLRVEQSTGYRLYEVDSRGKAIGCEWTVSIFSTR